MISSTFSFAAADAANVRLSTALDGGALMDVGCYCVSASRLLAGEPQRVSAEQALGGDGVDVAFTATMRFQNDVLAHFDAGLALDIRDRLEVVGEEGSLVLEDPWHCRSPMIEHHQASGTQTIPIEQIDSYRLEAENLSAAIRGRRPPLLGRDDAVGQAKAIEALYESAASGRTVSLASE
jgi:predicted dehydrogenase